MAESLTHYGIDDASNLMYGFHDVGNKALSGLLKFYSKPEDRKTLRIWGIRDAASLIGRTEQHIRKSEEEGGAFYPPIVNENGKRYYTLERINAMRDQFKTRYMRDSASKPIIMSVTNFKGGVAKSTTTLHLAQKCALEGLRVLCIDLDPQATMTLGFGYIPDIHLTGEDTVQAALTDSPKNIKSLIKKTYFDGIDLVPGNLALSEVELSLTDVNTQKDVIKVLGMPHRRLSKAIDVIAEDYDVCLLDCGPNMGILTINAVTASNALLVPIPPLMSDFASFVTFSGSLGALFGTMDKKFDFFRVLLTKHPESKESKAIELMMRERFGKYMLLNHVRTSVEIEKSSAAFGSVYELDKSPAQPYKRALESLDSVMNEIISAFKAIWQSQSIGSKGTKTSVEILKEGIVE